MPTDVWERGRGDGPPADVASPVTCHARQASGDKAIQITRINRIAIISWVNRSGKAAAFITKDGISIRTPCLRLRTAVIGDWVVRTWDDQFYTLPPEMFSRMFQTQGRGKR